MGTALVKARGRMPDYVKRLLTGDTGATALEYGFMVALVGAVLLLGAQRLGVSVAGMFTDLASNFTVSIAPD